jgi:hypothetical protein
MCAVIATVVAQETSLRAIDSCQFLNTAGPVVSHFLPEAFDDPHGADEPYRVCLRRAIHQVTVQRFGARISASLADDIERAAGSDKVLFENFVVAVLVERVADDYRANIGVIAIEA